MKKIKLLIKNNKSFIVNALIPLIVLFILLFAFYPGITTYDGNFQWKEVQSELITNSHPFFSTFFMFLLSKIWNSITIIAVYQILLFSFVWGYLCQKLKCTKRQEYIKYLFSFILSLIPIIGIYQITIWKDIIYTSYLFFISILLFNWANNDFKHSKIKYVVLGILLALIFNYRLNGIIVCIVLLIIISIILIKRSNNKAIIKQNLKKICLLLTTFVFVIVAITIPKNIITKSSEKEILQTQKDYKKEISLSSVDCYMLWMFGAHIIDNNIKDKNDLEFLNNIIPIEEWKLAYNSYLINGTNLATNLNKKYIIDNEKKFRDLFVKYTLKYPNTIIHHYLKSDGLLINPISMIDGYVYVFDFSEWDVPKGFYTKTQSKLPFIQNKYNAVINLTLDRPFIIMYQPAFILYLSIIIAAILAIKVYGKKIWMFCLPMFANTISLLPINIAQDLRYVYINYLTFFGLLLILIINYKKIFTRKSKKIKVE